MEQVAIDLREAAKEADRDNWEQQHSMFETLITSASVMLGGSCSIIVEGISSLPGECPDFEPAGECLGGRADFQFAFCFMLGLSYGCLFMCILLAMVVSDRMSKFMQEKAKAQRRQIGEVYDEHMRMLDETNGFPKLEDDFEDDNLSVVDRENLLNLFTKRGKCEQAIRIRQAQEVQLKSERLAELEKSKHGDEDPRGDREHPESAEMPLDKFKKKVRQTGKASLFTKAVRETIKQRKETGIDLSTDEKKRTNRWMHIAGSRTQMQENLAKLVCVMHAGKVHVQHIILIILFSLYSPYYALPRHTILTVLTILHSPCRQGARSLR
jgi:hypothetical protein